MTRKKRETKGSPSPLPEVVQSAITFKINRERHRERIKGFTLTGTHNRAADKFCRTFPEAFKNGDAHIEIRAKSIYIRNGALEFSSPINERDLSQLSNFILKVGEFREHDHCFTIIDGPPNFGFTLTAVPTGRR